MGQYKSKGNSELALVEELAELTQVILKKHRFDSDWHTIPPGRDVSRAEDFFAELDDINYHLNWVKKNIIDEMSLFCKNYEIDGDKEQGSDSYFTLLDQYHRYMIILQDIEDEKIAEHFRVA